MAGWHVSSRTINQSLTATAPHATIRGLHAMAQIPAPSIPPIAPHPNPSSSLVLRQAPPILVSPARNFYPGSNLAGTNQVVNPPLGVFHAHHKRRHHYV